MSSTFLFKVWVHNRKLVFILVLFILGTAVCNLAGVQITPFFVWGMYSEKEPPANSYEYVQTTINDSLVLDPNQFWSNDTRFFLTSPVDDYVTIRENNDVDPTVTFVQSKGIAVNESMKRMLFNTTKELDAFMPWYGRYLSSILETPVNILKLEKVRVHYEGSALVKDSTYLIETWRK